jgi:hypothetical protein
VLYHFWQRCGVPHLSDAISIGSCPFSYQKRKQRMVVTGTVKRWLDQKGFGFITPDNSTEEIFGKTFWFVFLLILSTILN